MKCGPKMSMNDPHKMSNIYDLLNDQPDLQKLVKYYYYVSLIPEQRQHNHKLAIGELDRAFTNCRQHMQEMLGGSDEDDIIDFMVASAPVAYNKCSFKYVFNDFYGEDWADYYYHEYLEVISYYSDESDESDE